jgi:hypothetical protein
MTMIISGSDGLEFPDGSDQGTAFTGNAATITSGVLAVAQGGTGQSNLSSVTVGTATSATSADSVSTTNWTIAESGGKLVFSYGGVAKGSLDSSGNFIVTGNVTAYGTP